MRQLIQSMSLPLACALLWACSAPETKSPVETPGRPVSATTLLLDAGAAALQSKPPIEAINAYVSRTPDPADKVFGVAAELRRKASRNRQETQTDLRTDSA